MLECLKEACGIFGAHDFGNGTVFPYLYWGLRAQNHRGHQSHGFITFDGKFHAYKGLDLVPKIKRKDIQQWLENLPGCVGIGNVRYATSGKTDEESLINDTQPLLEKTGKAEIAISFNGNIVNGSKIKEENTEKFLGFQFNYDAQLISRKLLAKLTEGSDLASSVKSCMEELEGAFSVAGITQKGELFAFKDPYGIRPLCCGYSKDRKIWAVSSETVGLDINGSKFDFEIEPGELVIASKDGFVREQLVKCEKRALCAFEFAYFARPDSRLGDKFVYEVREEFGRNLGREYPETVRDIDVIISMPETGNDAAFGLHEQTGKRWERVSRRHRYVTERAFILLPEERYPTIDRKINILDHKIRGKNVAVTDDSIVRGDTTKVVVNKLRKMGAKKVYLLITFPRIIGPCFYGIDMTTYGELIGSRHTPEEIAEILGADAVNYQSVNGLIKATGLSRNELCLGCVTGKYPTPLAQKLADEMKEKFEKGCKETGRIYEVATHSS
ncbi:MAG: Glutamine--fructose-6-phosphate aminotransferase (isomerizing) [Candidatus Bathyarchaeota archaeon BA2]|nr:MAG: Glutamine--fructose-6-phosphate aminotransferase (isomerizing) [Candidatus Bathyarchaeota archaeon BA2]